MKFPFQKHQKSDRYNLTTGEMIGFAILLSAGFFMFFDLNLSVFLLLFFIVLCGAAPFIPCSNFYLPVICHGNSTKRVVALTFDDGPNEVTTPALIDLLAKHHVSATFFVTGKNTENYPDLIEKIIRSGHSVGNHTYSHDPLIMLKRIKALENEISFAQIALQKLGIVCYAFRPPVGITNPLLNSVLKTLGMYTVNFSCRSGDFGNRFLRNVSGIILKKVRPNDIILLHDVLPKNKHLFTLWLNHVESIIIGLKEKELSIVPLEEIIGKPIMKIINKPV